MSTFTDWELQAPTAKPATAYHNELNLNLVNNRDLLIYKQAFKTCIKFANEHNCQAEAKAIQCELDKVEAALTDRSLNSGGSYQ